MFCTNYSGFFFTFVTEPKITNITFTDCGAASPLSFFLLGYIALGFMETTSLELLGVTVEDRTLLWSDACTGSLVPRPPMHPMQSGNDTNTPVDDIPQRVDWCPAQSV